MTIDEHLEEILKLAPEENRAAIASHFRAAIQHAVCWPTVEVREPIQFYLNELDYVNAQLHPAQKCGHFLESFFQSCLRADAENYQLLRPILREFMAKYPASPERLEAERRDRGGSA